MGASTPHTSALEQEPIDRDRLHLMARLVDRIGDIVADLRLALLPESCDVAVRTDDEESQLLRFLEHHVANLPTSDPDVISIILQCEALDRAGIKNGSKAIDIYMFDAWTPAISARFGKLHRPATLRRWRAARQSGRRSADVRTVHDESAS